jgi:hypothetical protein
MMELVSWDDDYSQWKNKTCSKPPTRDASESPGSTQKTGARASPATVSPAEREAFLGSSKGKWSLAKKTWLFQWIKSWDVGRDLKL